MKYRITKPFLFLVGFILIVSLACGIGTPEEPAAPAPVEEAAPAQPVEQPPTEVPPTEPVAQQFYTETFDGDTTQWTYFLVDARESVPVRVEEDFGTMFVGTEDGRLLYNLESEWQWPYVTYDTYEYDNVRMDVVVENRGVNNNWVSLICRYTQDEGWYEFNIANNGLYNIYHAIVRSDGAVIYTEIADGGSNKIKAGKETNEYAIVCKDRQLELYINGYETRILEENNYALRDGLIGIGVASRDILPVKLEVDSITISQP
ncbi:MAG: hypothetical protein HN390_11590 [Anaerolineae bacterium]|mgnify:FL=1|jgi:hypothetical protein|nr:hypothetical protein [Anaerolineae bacterium]MBT6811545.1 hypothetical protein [Anaerolineae bacterium]MBT7190335.1 hypothetical protein [Anaerolineae bacterium]MBT7991740.1 hypothetical protein [Anaerolineae bacterium]